MKFATVFYLSTILLQADGCRKQEQKVSIPPTDKPPAVQRFVPLPPPQAGMMGVPWTGFFALDTQMGQLCLTTGVYIPEKYERLPTCDEDLRDNPTLK